MRFNRMMECGQTRKIVIGAVAAAAGAAGAVAILKKSGLKQSASSATYRASSKSKTVHQSGCRYYKHQDPDRGLQKPERSRGCRVSRVQGGPALIGPTRVSELVGSPPKPVCWVGLSLS